MKSKFWGKPSSLLFVLLVWILLATAVAAAPPQPDPIDSITLTLAGPGTALAGPMAKDAAQPQDDDFVASGLPGQPLLPTKVLHVALPPTADLASLRVEMVSQKTELLPGTHDVPPAPPLVTWVDGVKIEDWGEAAPYIVDGKDQRIYSRDAFFPQEPVVLLETGKMRKWRIAKLAYTAQQFNPQSGQLQSVGSVEVRLTFNTLAPPAGQMAVELLDKGFDERAQEMLINFEDAQSWYELPPELQGRQSVNDVVLPGYAIITTNAIVSQSQELDNFIDHKAVLGFNVLLITEDDYGALTGPPPDGTAEKIRQWLQDNYLDQNIIYVLLIGDPDPADPQRDNDDVGDVPMKMCYPRRGGYVTYDQPASGYQTSDIVQFNEFGDLLDPPQFDGSNFGLDLNISAFQIRSDNALPECDREDMLFVPTAASDIPGLGTVSANDVIRFDPGGCNYYGSGTFSRYLSGAAVGLTTWGEEPDALTFSPAGDLVISGKGGLNVPGPDGTTLRGEDEDLLVLDAAAGTWSLYLDGSTIPGMDVEDIDGAWIDPQSGDPFVSFRDEFTVGGTSGDGNTIVRIHADHSTSIKWQVDAAYGKVNGLQLGGLHDLDSPTDYLYADMDGSWDADGDGYYCEYSHDRDDIDYYADVYTGRISVYEEYTDWVARLDHVLVKSMVYENETDRAWRRSAFLPMAFLDTGSDGAYLAQYMMDDFLSPQGFSTFTMFQQEADTPCNSVLSSDADLVGGNTAGYWAANPSGLMTWVGHGYGQGAVLYWSPCHGGDLFVSSQTPALDDSHPAFTFHHSCSNGLVEVGDNVASELLYHGAIGTVGASRISWGFVGDWWSPSYYGADDGSLAYNYMERLSKSMPSGDALFEVKANASYGTYFGSYIMNLTGYNLLGDPSLGLNIDSHITGTVTAEAGGALLPDVYVAAYQDIDNDWQWAGYAYTDAAGFYDISGLAAGTYRVRFVDYSGYAPEYYNNALDLENATDIAVTAGSKIGGIDAALAELGHITGTVTNAVDGTPLWDIEVSAYPTDGDEWDWYVAYPDAAGFYDISGLATGTYHVCFYDYSGNYASECYDNADWAGTADIPVTAGSTTAGIDATLAEFGHITGTVTAEIGGAPLPGIEVSAHPEDGNEWEWHYTYTDDAGSYDISGLATGTYRVRFIDWNDSYAQEYYDNVSDLTSATDIAVTSGSTTAGIDAALAEGGHITGTVTAEAGGTPLGVRVSAYHKDGDEWVVINDVITDDAGFYDIAGLATGTYRVRFYRYSDYAPEFYNNAADVASATDIAVTAGSTTAGIDAALAETGHITGTVTVAAGGGPLEDVYVMAYHEDGGEWVFIGSDYTDDAGFYDIFDLVAGTYRVSFTDWSDSYAREYYDNAFDLAAAADILVTAGGTTAGIDAALDEGGHITGTVRAEAGGLLLEDIHINAYQQDNGNWSSVDSDYTDDTGFFDISGLATGTYRVYFTGRGYVPEYYDNAADLSSATDILVTVGSTTAGIDAALAKKAPPVNDELEGSLLLDPLPYQDTRDVSGATIAFDDPVLPCGRWDQGYGTVWYTLSPTEDLLLTVDTYGSDYDTVLAVWEAGADLVSVACNNDDYYYPQSLVADVMLSAGSTYYIEVAGYGSNVSELVLSVDAVPLPAYITVSGHVDLQGRGSPVSAGIIKLVDTEGNYPSRTTIFDALSGEFSVPNVPVVASGGSVYRIEARHTLYLGNTMTALLGTAPYNTAVSTLFGGNVNNDDAINILDLGCIGGSYLSGTGTCGGQGSTDVNGDGQTNIQDLAIAGGNYSLTGYQPW